MPDPIILAVFGVVFGIVMLITIAFGGFGGRSDKRLTRRLERLAKPIGSSAPASGNVDLRRYARDSEIRGLDRLIKRFLPRPEELRRRLARTGRRIAVGEYLLASLFIALLVGVGKVLFLGVSPVLGAIAGLAAGLGFPHMFVGRMIGRRMKAFTGQFPEAIDLIVRGLKSGLPVPVSMQTVSQEIPDPVASEFRQITDGVHLGQSLDDALRDAADRLPTPEFRFFVISLAVQRETGGNLAETLENLTDVLRKRRQMKLKIKAMSSEAKASAIILASLPFLVFGIVFTMNPGYVMQLFTDPRGMLMLGAGLASLGMGVIAMAKMIRFEI